MPCSIKQCPEAAVPGTRLCAEHLRQIDEVRSLAVSTAKQDAEPADSESADPYDIAVERFVLKIGMSDQMHGLTLALIDDGMQNASKIYPELKILSKQAMDSLASFLAVNVVSAIIQERAHLLARAEMLAGALPAPQAEGILAMIDEEIKSLTREPDGGGDGE